MILLLGDIHGDWNILKTAIQKSELSGAKAIIQVGDFCLFPEGQNLCPQNEKEFRQVLSKSKIPVYFVEGNHDDCQRWLKYTEVSQVYDDAPFYYIPRGTVMELDERTIAFMGGAASIDMAWRLREGAHWDELENIRQEDIENFMKNVDGKKIDIMVTHCPPNTVINQHFLPAWKLPFGVGTDWVDPNQIIIEDLWNKIGNPNIFSGHMHKRVVGQNYRILDINELLAV